MAIQDYTVKEVFGKAKTSSLMIDGARNTVELCRIDPFMGDCYKQRHTYSSQYSIKLYPITFYFSAETRNLRTMLFYSIV